jgi:hypothetical protein
MIFNLFKSKSNICFCGRPKHVVQHPKEIDQVRLARAVRADEHVEGTEGKFRPFDRSEAFNIELGKSIHIV